MYKIYDNCLLEYEINENDDKKLISMNYYNSDGNLISKYFSKLDKTILYKYDTCNNLIQVVNLNNNYKDYNYIDNNLIFIIERVNNKIIQVQKYDKNKKIEKIINYNYINDILILNESKIQRIDDNKSILINKNHEISYYYFNNTNIVKKIVDRNLNSNINMITKEYNKSGNIIHMLIEGIDLYENTKYRYNKYGFLSKKIIQNKVFSKKTIIKYCYELSK